MANGKVCPACGKDIGVWAIVAAGLPNRIRCPHCGTLLRYDGTFALLVLPFAIVILAALIVHEVAIDVGLPRPGLIVVVQVLLTWVPVEFLLALYLRDHRNLHLVKPRPGAPRGA